MSPISKLNKRNDLVISVQDSKLPKIKIQNRVSSN